MARELIGWSWATTKRSYAHEFSQDELVDEMLYGGSGVYRTEDGAKRAAEQDARSSLVTEGLDELPAWQVETDNDGNPTYRREIEEEMVQVVRPVYWAES